MSVQAVGEPAVTGVSPTTGPVAGGTSVTISGSLFTGVTAVAFGTTPATTFAFVSDSTITATSPAGSAGLVHVIVTNAVGPSIANSTDQFTYIAPPAPTVSSVSPSSGPTAGGTPVTIGGSAFTGATAVSFGAAAASFTVTNDSQIAATSPAGTGVVDVRVTTPSGGTSAIVAADHFTYAAGPTVTSVSPIYGSPSGATTVTINGANLTGASAVLFGANAATGVTVVSATQVTAISPAGTGFVGVTVTTPGGTAALSSAFNYGPTVTSVVPPGGPLAGGTSVTINGTNFTTATLVTFGTTGTTSFARSSDVLITVTSPGPVGAPVSVAVWVTTPGGTSSNALTSANTFRYAGAPTITAPLSPNIGGVLGLTPVTITGSGLLGATVNFGNFAAGIPVGQTSDTLLKVISPGGSGTVNVTVVAPGGTIILRAAFTYTTRCLTAALTANPPAAPAGATIVFTASSTGCPYPRYEFWLGYPNGTWHLRQYWGISTTWTWDSRGLPAGNYGVRLGANNAGDPLTSFEARGQLSYALSGCGSVTLTATLGSPETVGTVETFTASLITGCNSPRYEYWLMYPTTLYPSGLWLLVRAFDASPTWTWYTAGWPGGDYTIHVWANQAGNSTASPEAFGEIKPYTLVALAGCTTASLSPANPSQSAGTMVPLTASSTVCPSPTYEFWVQYPNGTWYLRQGWGGATFNWDTTFLAPGSYNVHVWANQAFHSTATWEAYGSDTVTLTGCSSAALSPATVSQSAGAPINFTASSVGCNPVYEFWVGYPNGSWVLKQGWGGAAFSWSTAGLSPGMYSVHAWANQQGASQATWEAYGTASVSLSTCASAALAPASVTKAVGSLVAFTAGSTGCLSPQFEYWVQYPNGTWYLKRPFLTDPTWSWDTTGLAKGTYTVHVWANNAGDSQAAWEAYGTSTVTLN